MHVALVRGHALLPAVGWGQQRDVRSLEDVGGIGAVQDHPAWVVGSEVGAAAIGCICRVDSSGRTMAVEAGAWLRPNVRRVHRENCGRHTPPGCHTSATTGHPPAARVVAVVEEDVVAVQEAQRGRPGLHLHGIFTRRNR